MTTFNLKRKIRPLYIPILKLFYYFRAPKRYRYIFKNIKNIKAKNILEVGTWNGSRALEMIKCAQRFTSPSDISYYGFDLFELIDDDIYKEELSKYPPTKQEVQKKIGKTEAQIYLFQGNTKETLPEAIKKLPKMDFIFIDGGHSIETIQSDWENIKTLMHANTVVLFDDYWRNRVDVGCKAIVDNINEDIFNVEILPIVDIFENKDFGHLEIQFAKVTLRIV
ncbi:class I SAM-dependent methyltransferase [candidate division KSB1 bacterium]